MYTNLGKKEGVRGSVYHALYIRVGRATRHTCTTTRHTTSKRRALPRRSFCFSNILDQNDDSIHTRTAEGEELACISRRRMPRHSQPCKLPPPLALSVVLALALPALMMWIVLLVLPQVSLYAAGCCKYIRVTGCRAGGVQGPNYCCTNLSLSIMYISVPLNLLSKGNVTRSPSAVSLVLRMPFPRRGG